jgi:hypothetical protein
MIKLDADRCRTSAPPHCVASPSLLRAVVNVEDMDHAAFPAVPVEAALFYRRALLMLHYARRGASCW